MEEEDALELDFDYIGTGGFLLQCRGIGTNGTPKESFETVGVTAGQRKKIQMQSPFFQHCLSHDMQEGRKQIIRKEDWTTAVGRHLIEALCKGRTTVSSLEMYRQVLEAADQALVDLRLCNLVNYLDATSRESTREKFLTLLSGRTTLEDTLDTEQAQYLDPPRALVSRNSYYRFRLVANVKSQAWNQLLDRDILLYRRETNYILCVHMDPDGPPRPVSRAEERRLAREATAKQQLDTRTSEYLVYGTHCLTALYTVRRTLAHYSRRYYGAPIPLMTDRDYCHHGEDNDSSGEDSDSEEEETFCLYFETTQKIPSRYHKTIDRLAGGEAYVRTCPDASETRTEGYTVKGSCDVLRRALRPLLEEELAKQQVENDAADPVLAPTERDAAGDPLDFHIPQEPPTHDGNDDDDGDDDDDNQEGETTAVGNSNQACSPAPPLSCTMVCSLRVDHPSPDTLGRLINATHEATDYPSTLGIIPSTDRYFFKKTARDIGAILDYLLDYSSPSRITRDFTVLECSTEDRNPF